MAGHVLDTLKVIPGINSVDEEQKTPISERKPVETIPINVFTGGTQTSQSGVTKTFSESELDQVVDSYSPENHIAPLIQGHEEQFTGAPSMGWVKNLYRDGLELFANVDLSGYGKSQLEEGNFRRVSCRFYPPDDPNNPTPGKLSLRHLALVAIPAVKGLAQFSESTTGLSFSEEQLLAMDYTFSEKEFSYASAEAQEEVKTALQGAVEKLNIDGEEEEQDAANDQEIQEMEMAEPEVDEEGFDKAGRDMARMMDIRVGKEEENYVSPEVQRLDGWIKEWEDSLPEDRLNREDPVTRLKGWIKEMEEKERRSIPPKGPTKTVKNYDASAKKEQSMQDCVNECHDKHKKGGEYSEEGDYDYNRDPYQLDKKKYDLWQSLTNVGARKKAKHKAGIQETKEKIKQRKQHVDEIRSATPEPPLKPELLDTLPQTPSGYGPMSIDRLGKGPQGEWNKLQTKLRRSRGEGGEPQKAGFDMADPYKPEMEGQGDYWKGFLDVDDRDYLQALSKDADDYDKMNIRAGHLEELAQARGDYAPEKEELLATLPQGKYGPKSIDTLGKAAQGERAGHLAELKKFKKRLEKNRLAEASRMRKEDELAQGLHGVPQRQARGMDVPVGLPDLPEDFSENYQYSASNMLNNLMKNKSQSGVKRGKKVPDKSPMDGKPYYEGLTKPNMRGQADPDSFYNEEMEGQPVMVMEGGMPPMPMPMQEMGGGVTLLILDGTMDGGMPMGGPKMLEPMPKKHCGIVDDELEYPVYAEDEEEEDYGEGQNGAGVNINVELDGKKAKKSMDDEVDEDNSYKEEEKVDTTPDTISERKKRAFNSYDDDPDGDKRRTQYKKIIQGYKKDKKASTVSGMNKQDKRDHLTDNMIKSYSYDRSQEHTPAVNFAEGKYHDSDLYNDASYDQGQLKKDIGDKEYEKYTEETDLEEKEKEDKKKKAALKLPEPRPKKVAKAKEQTTSYDYSERYQLELKAHEAAKQKRVWADYAEGLYTGGVLTESIVKQEDLVNALIALDNQSSDLSYSEGQVNPLNTVTGILSNLQPVVGLNGYDPDTDPRTSAAELFSEPLPDVSSNSLIYSEDNKDIAFSADSYHLHQRATKLAEAEGIEYYTAVQKLIS